MKRGTAVLAALTMMGAAMSSFGSMSAFNIPVSRNATGHAFGFMKTSKHVRKTNKLRYSHNAKLKRRKSK